MFGWDNAWVGHDKLGEFHEIDGDGWSLGKEEVG